MIEEWLSLFRPQLVFQSAGFVLESAHHAADNSAPKPPVPSSGAPEAVPAALKIDVAPLSFYSITSLKSLNAGWRRGR
jgi:hypothetical protein